MDVATYSSIIRILPLKSDSRKINKQDAHELQNIDGLRSPVVIVVCYIEVLHKFPSI